MAEFVSNPALGVAIIAATIFMAVMAFVTIEQRFNHPTSS